MKIREEHIKLINAQTAYWLQKQINNTLNRNYTLNQLTSEYISYLGFFIHENIELDIIKRHLFYNEEEIGIFVVQMSQEFNGKDYAIHFNIYEE